MHITSFIEIWFIALKKKISFKTMEPLMYPFPEAINTPLVILSNKNIPQQVEYKM